jgi:hypothetical protein
MGHDTYRQAVANATKRRSADEAMFALSANFSKKVQTEASVSAKIPWLIM